MMEAVAAATRARGSRLAALVNNASTFEYDTVQTMTPASWAQHIDGNLRGPLFLSQMFAQAAAGHDGDHDGGHDDGCIINILDNKVRAPNPDYFSYTISRIGMAGATEVLALALAPRIRVCGVAPGITLVSGAQTEEEFERAHRANPLGRGCTVDQIAGAVRFILATPSMTGQVLVIDGGQSLAKPPRDVAYL
jgi:NAD(P)-dependent dehydrogenase (short-subunit alcohol dehydrogenase family)